MTSLRKSSQSCFHLIIQIFSEKTDRGFIVALTYSYSYTDKFTIVTVHHSVYASDKWGT